MDADRLLAEFPHAPAARQAAILSQLRQEADALIAAAKRAKGLGIHTRIAHLKVPGGIDGGFGGMMNSLLIDASRELCEAEGIPCPPSTPRAHQLELANRPAKDRIPPRIRALVLKLGLGPEHADELRPYQHPESDWHLTINMADHSNKDPDVYVALLAYVREHKLCDARTLKSLPGNREEFVAKHGAKAAGRKAFAAFLAKNDAHAEAAFRKLIAALRKAKATTATLIDGYDHQLDLALDHDGSGSGPKRIALVEGYATWAGKHADFHPGRGQCWQWMHARWLEADGDDSGLTVKVFYNNSGEEMDLDDGPEE
jgi:hypothetical protein